MSTSWWMVFRLLSCKRIPITHERFSSPGFPVRKSSRRMAPKILHNHWDIIIDYHKAGIRGTQYRVVGVLVNPSSSFWLTIQWMDRQTAHSTRVLYRSARKAKRLSRIPTVSCGGHLQQHGPLAGTSILHVVDPKIHWFSLINSTVFVLFLVGMVGSILVRALRKDIARYTAGLTTSILTTSLGHQQPWRTIFKKILDGSLYMVMSSALHAIHCCSASCSGTALNCSAWQASHCCLQCSASCHLLIAGF